MPSGRDRRTEKHELIRDSAIEVFAERGFHQARISDIARRAGVADGTIYLYFRNKEELLICIFEEKMELLLQGLKLSLEGIDDPCEQVERFARYHMEQVQNRRSLAEVLQVELRLSNKFLKDYRPEKLWEYLGVFRQIVTHGQEQGVFRADLDPFLTSWAFFGSLDEIASQWVLSRKKPKFELDAAAEQVAGMFLHSLQSSASHASNSQEEM